MALFKLVLFLFLYQYSGSVSHAQQSDDYQYVESKNSLYKLHETAKTWYEAKATCVEEGAYLLYPQDAAEAAVMSNMMSKNMNFSSNWVFVDASANISQEIIGNSNGNLETDVYLHNSWKPGQAIDENPQLCVIFKRRDGTMVADDCGNKHYFFCKKATPRVLSWHNECNMLNLGYKYDEASKRCYKFHPNPSNLNWNEARAACKTEMSYLAVIDNQVEADLLSNLTMNYRTSHNEDHHRCVFLGFQKINSVWRTVRGLPLTYNGWGNGEPNNIGGQENCGAMFFNGKFNDVNCDSGSKGFFICEHEVHRSQDRASYPKIDNTQTVDYFDSSLQ